MTPTQPIAWKFDYAEDCETNQGVDTKCKGYELVVTDPYSRLGGCGPDISGRRFKLRSETLSFSRMCSVLCMGEQDSCGVTNAEEIVEILGLQFQTKSSKGEGHEKGTHLSV